MIISALKPWETVMGYLAAEKKVFLLGCKGCAAVSQTGGEPQVRVAAEMLIKEGKTVTGWAVADFLCDKAQIKMKLLPFRAEVESADSILVMTCGIGIQAAANAINKPVHPATNTISVGGFQGTWPGAERCRQCGDCVLEWTGGICPLTNCSKQLINGQCGGAKNGRCEVEPEFRPCGWQLIAERLEKIGKLDYLKAPVIVKKWNKMQPPPALRSTIMWAVEQQEVAAAPGSGQDASPNAPKEVGKK